MDTTTLTLSKHLINRSSKPQGRVCPLLLTVLAMIFMV